MPSASTLGQKVNDLAALTRDELMRRASSMAASIKRVREKGKAPLKQFACTFSGWTGGAVSGVTHYFLPELLGVPVDGAVGVLISLGSLAGAGKSDLADASAVFGVGLTAPAISRGVENGIRTLAAKSSTKK